MSVDPTATRRTGRSPTRPSIAGVLGVRRLMFAPRQEVAAAELRARLPARWRHRGRGLDAGRRDRPDVHDGRQAPAAAARVRPAACCGASRTTCARLLEPHGVELEFKRSVVVYEAESSQEWLEYNERVFGPLILARAGLEPEGRYEALRDDLLAAFEQASDATDGSMHTAAEFLMTIARRPG